MKRPNVGQSLLLVGISIVAGSLFVGHALGAQAPAAAEFSNLARALPFPPDAREVEFDARFDDIEFTSASPLASLADLYARQMQQRGWEQDASAAVHEKDSVEMTFKHGDAQVVIELDQRSDNVAVSMDCEGLDFAGTDDPAGLVAAGVPQPRSYLYLQKEIPRPAEVRDSRYESDGCHFKSPMALQAAFDHYLTTLKGLGWRESRRPIVTSDRRYTEFKRGPITVSVNIFSDEVGSRIILEYEDDRREPIVPPLPTVAAASPSGPGRVPTPGGAPDEPAKVAVDVSTNTGSATVIQGRNRHVFKYVAAYQTKDEPEKTTLVFADRPIPFQRMQTMLAKEDSFSFLDLFETGWPGSLKIQVNGYNSFSFNAGGVGIGDAIEDPDGQIKVEQGRARGTIKMREPKQFFDEPFHLTATIDAAVLTPNTRLGGAAGPTGVSRRESPVPGSELLLPEGASDVRSEGTRYRKSTHAAVDMELQPVADFYRQELAAQQWKEDQAARVAGDGTVPRATLLFRGAAGKMTVNLQREGERTVIDLTSTDDARARSDGVLPEPGKARLVMGNAHSRDVVIAIGKQDYPLKAGRGAQDPKTALNYSIAPGKYVVTIKIPGEAPQTETLEIGADTAWGVIALPTGGYMASQLY
ncbi:MAG: hypothetical protein HY000_40265 [Planctomycetes bacterium]|nr:hypothetical protein [Planctomycetota bacterium]